MSETTRVTKPIQDALTKAGYFCMRMNSGKVRKGKYWIRLCPEGTADLLLLIPFRLPIWIETKKIDGRTNPEQVMAQANFAYLVESLGHVYLRVTTLDEVLKVL